MADAALYLAHFKGWDDDRLFTAARDVEQLTQHPGWRVLNDMLEQGKRNAETRLYRTALPEDREITRLIGFLQGLLEPQIAAEAFATAAERRRKHNDDHPDGEDT